MNRTRSGVLCRGMLLLALLAPLGCVPQQQQPPKVMKFPPPPEHAAPPPPRSAQPIDPQLQAAALRELLADADANDATLRANAIEALREYAPDAAAGPVMKGLSDPDAGVRFAACVAAGEMILPQSRDRLLRMREGNDPAFVQVAVRFALHRLRDTRFSHDLEAFAADPDAEVRGRTALVLGLLGEKSASKILRPMLRDPQEPIRLQAAESLWRLGDDAGLDYLLGAAVSQFPDDLILATIALAAPKDQRVIQHVRANLVTDFPEVNLATARALGTLGSDEGYSVAIKGAKSPDARQRFLAALAFGAIGRADTQPTLADLLKDPTPSVRLGAATALLELNTPAASNGS